MKICSGSKRELGALFEEAAKLRYTQYLKMGFIKENPSKKLADSYDENAIHILGIAEKKVVGTLSIINPPLPLEELFQKEVEELKKRYHAKKIVELSRFAILPEFQVKNSKDPLSPKLFRTAYTNLLLNNTKLILAVVHPKYVPRYSKYGFKTYGKEKAYPKMEENPAILMYQTRMQALKAMLKNIFLPRKQKKSF